ncbi:recombinase family protein [Escherichia coli]
MSRTFAYCRVSTREQTAENQRLALGKAGYDIPASRMVSETISGSVQAMQRPKFATLVNLMMEEGDRLVVLKLDRLGRDNIDVLQTIELLTMRGITVISLDLPVVSLGSAEGKLMLGIMAAYAAFEKNRLIERTQEGLARAKQQGKSLGRPVAVDTVKAVLAQKKLGRSQSQAAAALGLSRSTIKRYWRRDEKA